MSLSIRGLSGISTILRIAEAGDLQRLLNDGKRKRLDQFASVVPGLIESILG